MDILLSRILDLIPKKPNGTFVHGAKKEFCQRIGAPENIVSDWITGRSKSYEKYLYQIAAKYGVSVEWLKGETDEKMPPDIDEELEPNKKALLEAVKDMSDAELMLLLEKIKQIKEIR